VSRVGAAKADQELPELDASETSLRRLPLAEGPKEEPAKDEGPGPKAE